MCSSWTWKWSIGLALRIMRVLSDAWRREWKWLRCQNCLGLVSMLLECNFYSRLGGWSIVNVVRGEGSG